MVSKIFKKILIIFFYFYFYILLKMLNMIKFVVIFEIIYLLSNNIFYI